MTYVYCAVVMARQSEKGTFTLWWDFIRALNVNPAVEGDRAQLGDRDQRVVQPSKRHREPERCFARLSCEGRNQLVMTALTRAGEQDGLSGGKPASEARVGTTGPVRRWGESRVPRLGLMG